MHCACVLLDMSTIEAIKAFSDSLFEATGFSGLNGSGPGNSSISWQLETDIGNKETVGWGFLLLFGQRLCSGQVFAKAQTSDPCQWQIVEAVHDVLLQLIFSFLWQSENYWLAMKTKHLDSPHTPIERSYPHQSIGKTWQRGQHPEAPYRPVKHRHLWYPSIIPCLFANIKFSWLSDLTSEYRRGITKCCVSSESGASLPTSQEIHHGMQTKRFIWRTWVSGKIKRTGFKIADSFQDSNMASRLLRSISWKARQKGGFQQRAYLPPRSSIAILEDINQRRLHSASTVVDDIWAA